MHDSARLGKALARPSSWPSCGRDGPATSGGPFPSGFVISCPPRHLPWPCLLAPLEKGVPRGSLCRHNPTVAGANQGGRRGSLNGTRLAWAESCPPCQAGRDTWSPLWPQRQNCFVVGGLAVTLDGGCEASGRLPPRLRAEVCVGSRLPDANPRRVGWGGRGPGGSPSAPAGQGFGALRADAAAAPSSRSQREEGFPGAQPPGALPGHRPANPPPPRGGAPRAARRAGAGGSGPPAPRSALGPGGPRPRPRRAPAAGVRGPGGERGGGLPRRPLPFLLPFPAAGMRSEAAPQPGGLERFVSAGKGRGLRARRRYAVGELLFSCPAYTAVLTVSERGSHCDGCFAR